MINDKEKELHDSTSINSKELNIVNSPQVPRSNFIDPLNHLTQQLYTEQETVPDQSHIEEDNPLSCLDEGHLSDVEITPPGASRSSELFTADNFTANNTSQLSIEHTSPSLSDTPQHSLDIHCEGSTSSLQQNVGTVLSQNSKSQTLFADKIAQSVGPVAKYTHGGGSFFKQLKSIRKRVTNIVTPPKPGFTLPTTITRPNQPKISNDSNILLRPRRITRENKPHPRYIGAYQENCFICESVQFLLRTIFDFQQERPYSKVVIGLSGGSTPRKIFTTLALLCSAAGSFCKRTEHTGLTINKGESFSEQNDTDYGKIDWNRVIIFLLDERYVLPTDDHSNQKMIRDTLLSNKAVNIPEDNLIFPNTELPLQECISDYQAKLSHIFSFVGRPHLVTLGLGDDGHVASWFPPLSSSNFQLAYSKKKLVSHTIQDRFDIRDRITVSMDIITSAAKKLFLLSGPNKLQKWNALMELDDVTHFQSEPVLQIVASEGVTVISYPPLVDDIYKSFHDGFKGTHLSIVIFGASGDLARKKTIPALFSLFCEGHLPDNFHIVGYARSSMTITEFWDKLSPYLLQLASFFVGSKQYQRAIIEEKSLGFLEKFRARLIYISGEYDTPSDFLRLRTVIDALEEVDDTKHREDEIEELQEDKLLTNNLGKRLLGNRLFYLALPPTIFPTTIQNARSTCWSDNGWNRVVIEKPFGKDSKSATLLSDQMLAILKEEETYRIDHYLGKEMVLNLMAFRFANAAFAPLMSWHFVSAVRITFKETIGTDGRGGYFDQFGIIRDILQNHLLQLLTIIAMERPASLKDDDVRDEKVKILKQISPIKLSDTVVGQYTKSLDGKQPGYLEDPTVPKGSLCPTFCTAILWINNERWSGVPFILKAGKALEERLAEIRIQLRPVPGNIFGASVPQNELVVKVQPTEAIYMKVMTKKPGLNDDLEQTELDLSVMDRFDVDRMPDAYERLLVDVMKGDKQNFVRTDELKEAWKIFTPLLYELESKHIKPILYPAGSRGPEEAYELIKANGYTKYEGYKWSAL